MGERGGGGSGKSERPKRPNIKILKLNFYLCFFTIQKYTMPLLEIMIERDIEIKV